MFGVKNAPNVWQRFMDSNIVKGLAGVACFFDDIIISGKTLEETEARLRTEQCENAFQPIKADLANFSMKIYH